MLASHSAGRCLVLLGRRRASEPATFGGKLGALPALDGISGEQGSGICSPLIQREEVQRAARICSSGVRTFLQ
jgi:hypothetical protein